MDYLVALCEDHTQTCPVFPHLPPVVVDDKPGLLPLPQWRPLKKYLYVKDNVDDIRGIIHEIYMLENCKSAKDLLLWLAGVNFKQSLNYVEMYHNYGLDAFYTLVYSDCVRKNFWAMKDAEPRTKEIVNSLCIIEASLLSKIMLALSQEGTTLCLRFR